MIIKSIELKNIRSYADTQIDFPTGIILFEGDIGSGKSTILLAIEFALFGLGDLKGSYLLRLGCSSGYVKLRFEVEGKEYEVFRRLVKKSSSVTQEEGYIESEGVKRILSPSELKQAVLDILKFNEPPNPRAQSVIYRYALYTPQEQMKEILWAKPDERLQTLRKAFGIEDYKIALENVHEVIGDLKESVSRYQERVRDIEAVSTKLEECRISLQQSRIQLTAVVGKYSEFEAELKKIQTELESKLTVEREIEALKSRKPLLERELKEKTEKMIKLSSESYEVYRRMIDEINLIEGLPKIDKPTEMSEGEIKNKLKELDSSITKLRGKEASIESKIHDYQQIIEKKICPTCDRPADPVDIQSKIDLKQGEKETISNSIRELETSKNNLEETLEKLREYNELQIKLKTHLNILENYTNTVNRNYEEINNYAARRVELFLELSKLEESIRQHEDLAAKIAELRRKVADKQNELNKLSSERGRLEQNIINLEKEIKDLESQLAEKERFKRLLHVLEEYIIWLKEFFEKSLVEIEKHVMLSINQEFNNRFQRWFNLLVEDNSKEARVDEDFNPIIAQDGYEPPLESLSGGEKTSIALAYRLTLNTIVQRLSVGLKSNLLILDEPTDGFSKEQLFKIRDILDEIKAPQVIIVSHERELESFANHIFRIEKVNGLSRITSTS
ncbi:MAG: SMC family ATPase [Candidatus Odinarchaeum yellowstonii]|uniref:SMC family ATPase n=1 Tax=Odinarchaeota yellowstonii (strain LCB_4) TaxID=1841599 RepID=A0AAF0D296_ODILC|nr:MAG: SMC family ATPase [Candidatus Odinarchaeum yellowstonii]